MLSSKNIFSKTEFFIVGAFGKLIHESDQLKDEEHIKNSMNESIDELSKLGDRFDELERSQKQLEMITFAFDIGRPVIKIGACWYVVESIHEEGKAIDKYNEKPLEDWYREQKEDE